MIHEIDIRIVPGSACSGWLYTYLWDNSIELEDGRLRPLVLLCPGGGYEMTSDREAEAMALKFMTMGCHAAVLRYSVAPARYPEALLQLAQSVRLIRQHAKEWYVMEDAIVVQGSSAGGHLAGCLGVFWDREFLWGRLGCTREEIRPDRLILSYPVISAGNVPMPGVFIIFWAKHMRIKKKNCPWKIMSVPIRRPHFCGIRIPISLFLPTIDIRIGAGTSPARGSGGISPVRYRGARYGNCRSADQRQKRRRCAERM